MCHTTMGDLSFHHVCMCVEKGPFENKSIDRVTSPLSDLLEKSADLTIRVLVLVLVIST